MSALFKNKYRIPSARLQSWDYASNAIYFVTICTGNREHYFGEISGDRIDDGGTAATGTVETRCIASLRRCIASLRQSQQLYPTEIGKIAHNEWYKTAELRRDMNLELGEFVVMPNHIHGIITIGDNIYNRCRDAMHGVSTETETKTKTTTQNRFAPQSKNLASIIRGYKSAVTLYARKKNIPFDWQRGYYEHIIRSQDEYRRISEYIRNNPTKWAIDRFNKS